ncbi:MAG: MFS transporter, partial [Candidatus Thorarchaeota archaeon]
MLVKTVSHQLDLERVAMGLRASGHAKTLIMLYVVTLVMRAAFYATIASVQNSSYLGGAVSTWDVAVIMMIYPLSELASVSFFGSYSDKIGRRPVLITSLLLTSCATLLFATATSPVFTYGYAVIFGLGAASQVATSLSMIADCSSPFNRARLMGYYDLSTLGGLGGGYGLAMIMLRFGVQAYNVLQLATIASLISVVVAIGIKETRRVQSRDVSVMKLLRKVASDRRIQLLMPVYIPIISLYGLVIANA